MPNWCSNTLTIKGSPKELSKLMKAVEITNSEETSEHFKSLFSCHRVIPRPASENANWYNWNVDNWGSKWDLADVERQDSEWESGALTYTFNTAWSPVPQVIEKLAKQNKKVTIKYEYWEGGSDYWGEHTYEKGKEVEQIGGSINDAGCEKLEELMGEHHECKECWEMVECEKENTPEYCESCEEERTKEESTLWEGIPHGDKALSH